MNIFIAKINYSTKVGNLKKLFEEYGEVTSAKIATDRETQKSKGFGFIEMPNKNEALAAIKALDGYELDGRNIVVQESNR